MIANVIMQGQHIPTGQQGQVLYLTIYIYLFDREQIKHIRKVQHHWQISYADSEKNQILKELETQTGARVVEE